MTTIYTTRDPNGKLLVEEFDPRSPNEDGVAPEPDSFDGQPAEWQKWVPVATVKRLCDALQAELDGDAPIHSTDTQHALAVVRSLMTGEG